ncbi:MAG TPA: DUF167 domain-containing protein [Candidatus Sulfotelmatobacter sp.]
MKTAMGRGSRSRFILARRKMLRRSGRRAEIVVDHASGRESSEKARVELFAKLLKVSRSSVTIASGLNSRNKVIRVAGVTAEYARSDCAADVDQRFRAAFRWQEYPRHTNNQELL